MADDRYTGRVGEGGFWWVWGGVGGRGSGAEGARGVGRRMGEVFVVLNSRVAAAK